VTAAPASAAYATRAPSVPAMIALITMTKMEVLPATWLNVERRTPIV
jgi:hypothetical protein